jgi:hypothetical protein
MIIVIGSVALLGGSDSVPHGVAAGVALAAATLGRSVQFVGKVGEDDAGDAVVLALAKERVGHVAVLREAGRATVVVQPGGDPAIDAEAAADAAPGEGPALEAADVDLALRYLTDFSVIVLVDATDDATARVVGDAAAWSGARLIVVVPLGAAVPDGLPGDAIVFEAPDVDPDGAFANLVGAFAAALDGGDEPGDAFRSTVAAEGWTAAAGDAEDIDDGTASPETDPA